MGRIKEVVCSRPAYEVSKISSGLETTVPYFVLGPSSSDVLGFLVGLGRGRLA